MADIEKVKQVLETVRPYLQMDGGDVEFVAMNDEGVVTVKLKGACAGCPGATRTLKLGIERKLMEECPEVKSVEAAPF
jgi:Fe-S cluster biogenesis protein NfuA